MHESTINPLNVIAGNKDHQHIGHQIKHDVVPVEHLQARIRFVVVICAHINITVIVHIHLFAIVVPADRNFKVEHGTVVQEIN